jgi:uncharacterized protein YgbK (DUF1537 family)
MDSDDLLLGIVGDDFTGSTDALELLAVAGIPTLLYARPPASIPAGIRAVGIATRARSMSPDEMTRTLAPAFASLDALRAPIVHYKVCSTFDSSPAVGSIGRAIDVGFEAFGCSIVPVIAGAPSLGRYCVFGNLFARCGADPLVHRLDRHPSMSRHPVTPMHEADLRLHLAKQTTRAITQVDVVTLERSCEASIAAMRAAPSGSAVLIDLASESHLQVIGAMLADGPRDRPAFVVGSSGVESALLAHWRQRGSLPACAAPMPTPPATGPVLIACGSCSPVTAGQIAWAADHGFVVLPLGVAAMAADVSLDRLVARAAEETCVAIAAGRSVVVYTAADARVEPSPLLDERIGQTLGRIVREALARAGGRVSRVLVAGGDTSGRVAETLGLETLAFSAPLVRGVPICRASAAASPADGIEIAFKGGQIGSPSLFGQLLHGGTP